MVLALGRGRDNQGTLSRLGQLTPARLKKKSYALGRVMLVANAEIARFPRDTDRGDEGHDDPRNEASVRLARPLFSEKPLQLFVVEPAGMTDGRGDQLAVDGRRFAAAFRGLFGACLRFVECLAQPLWGPDEYG